MEAKLYASTVCQYRTHGEGRTGRTATAYSSVPLGSTSVLLIVAFVGLNLWYFTSFGCAIMFSASFSRVCTKHTTHRHCSCPDGYADEGNMYLERLQGDMSWVWAQDTGVDHPPELLPLLMIVVEVVVRGGPRCSGCLLPLGLESALNRCRHSVVVWTVTGNLRNFWLFNVFGIHIPVYTACGKQRGEVSRTRIGGEIDRGIL